MKRKEGGLKRINCVVLSSCGWLIDRWEGRRGWSPLHATISLGGETTAVVDAYRSPRAPHITITMVYNAVSAKISRGYTGYTPFRVPSPVKNLINRHRGGGLTCTFLLLFFCLPWKKFVRTAIRTIVCNLFESDREVYSNFPASVPHFHIVSTSSPLPPLLSPRPLSVSHARHISNFIRLDRIYRLPGFLQ